MVRKRAGNSAQGLTTQKVAINAPEITWAKYKIGTYDAPWSDKNTARDAVRLERRLELALEGHRIFDLQRWGNLVDVVSNYLTREKKVVPILNGGGLPSSKNMAFPIPSSEVTRSNGNIKQNDGF